MVASEVPRLVRLLVSLVALVPLFGQALSPPVFEVASVRTVEGPRGRLYDFSSSGPRVRYIGYSPRHLIMEAYDLKNYQVVFAPATARMEASETLYDIEAQSDGERALARREFRPMLQSLLADRFQLKVHRATKELPVYALVVGKNGVKFEASAPDAIESRRVGTDGRRNQSITAVKTGMDEFAPLLASVFGLDRPVEDRTGLRGSYDFRIEATPEFRLGGDDPDAIRVFTAIQQQLGLKLEPQRGMVEVLVVDGIEKPSAN